MEFDAPFYVISLRGPMEIPGAEVLDFTPWTLVARDTWSVDDFDVGVITSPFAAEQLVRRGADFLQGKIWVAPGSGTAAVISPYEGIAAPLHDATAEGMLELPELNDVHGQQIAVFTAPGGRNVIVPTLRERGADVEEVHVYDRVPKTVSAEAVKRWRSIRTGKNGVLWVTSFAAYRELTQQIDEPLAALTCVVSSERLAELMRGAGHLRVIVVSGPSVDSLQTALEQVTSR